MADDWGSSVSWDPAPSTDSWGSSVTWDKPPASHSTAVVDQDVGTPQENFTPPPGPPNVLPPPGTDLRAATASGGVPSNYVMGGSATPAWNPQGATTVVSPETSYAPPADPNFNPRGDSTYINQQGQVPLNSPQGIVRASQDRAAYDEANRSWYSLRSEDSLPAPYRALQTGAMNLAGNVAKGVYTVGSELNVPGATGARDSVSNLMQQFNQQQADLDRQGALGQTATGLARNVGGMLIELSALPEAGGESLLSRSAPLAGYFGANGAVKSLEESDKNGITGPSKHSAATLATAIDAGSAVAMVGLGTGLGKFVEGMGAENAPLLSKAVGALSDKFSIGKYVSKVGEVGAETGGQVGVGMATEAAHYMAEVATGQHPYNPAELNDRMLATVLTSAAAGLAGSVLNRRSLESVTKGISNAIENRLNALNKFVAKSDTGGPITRGDLEQIGLPSGGTTSIERTQMGQQLAEEVRQSRHKPPESEQLSETQAASPEAQTNAPQVEASQGPQEDGVVPKESSTGLTELGTGSGKAIADNYYEGLRSSLSATGDVPHQEAVSSVGKAWRIAKASGVDPGDFVDALKSAQPETPADWMSLVGKFRDIKQTGQPILDTMGSPESPTPRKIAQNQYGKDMYEDENGKRFMRPSENMWVGEKVGPRSAGFKTADEAGNEAAESRIRRRGLAGQRQRPQDATESVADDLPSETPQKPKGLSRRSTESEVDREAVAQKIAGRSGGVGHEDVQQPPPQETVSQTSQPEQVPPPPDKTVSGFGGKTVTVEKPARPGDQPDMSAVSADKPGSAVTSDGMNQVIASHTPGLERGGLVSGLKSLLLPTSKGPEQLHAAELLRSRLGVMHRMAESSKSSMDQYWKMFNKMGLDRADVDPADNQGAKFRSAMSSGESLTGKMESASKAVTKEFQDRLKMLDDLEIPMNQIRENYFPGMWTLQSRRAFNAAVQDGVKEGVIKDGMDLNDANAQQKAWIKKAVDENLKGGKGSDADALQALARRPMHGTQSFRKAKVFDDTMTAEEFGLRPFSQNPIDTVQAKMAEMDRAIMAHGFFSDLKKEGKTATIGPYDKLPPGYVKIDDRYGTVYGPPTIKIDEHVDRDVYDGLLDVAKGLGVTHERKASLKSVNPGKTSMGLSYNGSGKIETRFATELNVLAHEIGHQIDIKYPEVQQTLLHSPGDLGDKYKEQLTDIARFTERGDIAHTPKEKIAQVLEIYSHSPDRMQEMAPDIYSWFDQFVKSKPELAKLADIRPGLAMKRLTTDKYVGLPIMGYRVVPSSVGDVVNNYLSSSLYNNKYFGTGYKAWMGMTNLLNQSQLGGASAYHAGFTAGESQVSSIANVYKDIYGVARGNRSISDLASTVANAATAIPRNPYVGDKVLNAWRNRNGVIDPKIRSVVKAAELAGASFDADKTMMTKQFGKMTNDWYSGKVVSAAARSPAAFTEVLAHPVVKWIVPRQKAGVFADMASRIIEQNPGKSLESLAPEFGQAWNRVDARLGQVVYDRLFVNNTAKNLIQATVRSPGWTGGTIAEVGGAIPDAAKFLGEFAKTGKLPQEMPDRVAYTMALLTTTAVVNGALTYMFTGKQPHGIDFFAFRDGGKDKHGNDTRFVLPTYAKDLWSYYNNTGQTFINKASPLISMLSQLAQNKDYYGTEIRNPEDSRAGQAYETGKFVVSQYVPFWLRGAQKSLDEGGGYSKVAASYVGIMPAGSSITSTPAAQAVQAYNDSQGHPTRTPEQSLASQQKYDFEDKAIKDGGLQELKARLDEQVVSGKIAQRQAKRMFEDAHSQPMVRKMKYMPLDAALKPYNMANSDEKTPELKAMMEGKLARALSTAPYDDPQNGPKAILEQAKAAGLDTDAAIERYATELARRATDPDIKKPKGFGKQLNQATADERTESQKRAWNALKSLGLDDPAKLAGYLTQYQKEHKQPTARFNTRDGKRTEFGARLDRLRSK